MGFKRMPKSTNIQCQRDKTVGKDFEQSYPKSDISLIGDLSAWDHTLPSVLPLISCPH